MSDRRDRRKVEVDPLPAIPEAGSMFVAQHAHSTRPGTPVVKLLREDLHLRGLAAARRAFQAVKAGRAGEKS